MRTKRPARAFRCEIAQKTVWGSLRHGGGLGEPASPYVRCEERDCQHVDLNLPPCPLRVDLFADSTEKHIADYLQKKSGARVCYSCLTARLPVTHDQVRRASWTLKSTVGLLVRVARCAECKRRAVTLALSDSTPARDREARLDPAPSVALEAASVYLRDRAGYRFCDRCLARDLIIPVTTIREAMLTLGTTATFETRTAQCVSCLLSKRTIRFERVADEEDCWRRVLAFLNESRGDAFCPSCLAFGSDVALAHTRGIVSSLDSGGPFVREDATCSACGRLQTVVTFPDAALSFENLEYRGFRIAVLPFRTTKGWRSFAVVTAVTGGRIPGAPGFISTQGTTREETGERALAAARAWIDTRGD